MIKITDSPDVNKWSEFVYSHPYGNIFQTPEMAEVYRHTKNYEPISLAAINDNSGEIIGILQGVLIKEMGGLLKTFSTRSIIQGGPLSSNNYINSLLLNQYDKISEKKSLFTQIRVINNMSSFSDQFIEANYKYEDHLNFVTDLTKTIDELWKQLYKSKRQAINKANNNGVFIEEINKKELVSIFYNIVRKSYDNSKMPFVDLSLFESSFDILVPKNLCKFFFAKYKDNYIAATCFLCFNGVIYDWYGGIDRKFSNYRPNELLEWYTIKWGAENNYRIFDFGGAGKPDKPYGPREFKKEFGGKLVNYGRWTKIYSPIKMKIAETGFDAYRKIFY